MSDCGTLTILYPLLIAVAPVVAGFLGFYLNHRLESQRQKDQRAFDFEMQQRQTRRDLLEQIQFVLAEVHDGAGTAATFMFVGEETGVESARRTLESPWYRDWQKGAQKVSVLAAQLGDEELRNAARNVGVDYARFLSARGNQEQFEQARDQLDNSYVRANERAGQLIQEIDKSSPIRQDTRGRMDNHQG